MWITLLTARRNRALIVGWRVGGRSRVGNQGTCGHCQVVAESLLSARNRRTKTTFWDGLSLKARGRAGRRPFNTDALRRQGRSAMGAFTAWAVDAATSDDGLRPSRCPPSLEAL